MNATIGERISITDWDDCRITVVIPTYNEADNLPAISEALLGLDWPYLQLLIVDDNSPDGTGAVADALAAKYNAGLHEGERPRFLVLHREGKGGLGTAYVAGMTRAIADGADYVVQMDADFSHSPRYLPQMLGVLLATGRRCRDRQPLRAGRLAGRPLGVEPATAQLVGQPVQPGDPGAADPRYDGRL